MPSSSTESARGDHPLIGPTEQWRFSAEIRALLRLAIPVVLSELAWMLMSVVDTIMVGRLSPEAIGAVGLSGSLYYIPALFALGLLLGLDTLVSQAHGAGSEADCRLWLTQGLYLAAITSPLVMALVYVMPLLLPSFGTSAVVAAQTTIYLRDLSWGTPALLAYAGFRRYLQGMGVVKPVMFALVSANLVNLAGNWVLIYGKLGLPALGIRGSAVSTVAARFYMAGFLLIVAWLHEKRRDRDFFAKWPAMHWAQMLRILQLGAPAACQMILEIGAFGAATIFASKLAPEVLAAHQVALSCASVTYMVPLGISASAAVAVGHAVGAKDYARARRTGWLAILVAGAFMAVMAALLVLFPRFIVRIYSPDPRVLLIGGPLLALAAVFQIFDGVQTAATGALRGIGKTKAPMLIVLVGYWLIGLPLGYYLCFHVAAGVVGVWIGLTLALIFVATLIVLEWRKSAAEAIGD